MVIKKIKQGEKDGEPFHLPRAVPVIAPELWMVFDGRLDRDWSKLLLRASTSMSSRDSATGCGAEVVGVKEGIATRSGAVTGSEHCTTVILETRSLEGVAPSVMADVVQISLNDPVPAQVLFERSLSWWSSPASGIVKSMAVEWGRRYVGEVVEYVCTGDVGRVLHTLHTTSWRANDEISRLPPRSCVNKPLARGMIVSTISTILVASVDECYQWSLNPQDVLKGMPFFFIFALAWGCGAGLTREGRCQLDKLLFASVLCDSAFNSVRDFLMQPSVVEGEGDPTTSLADTEPASEAVSEVPTIDPDSELGMSTRARVCLANTTPSESNFDRTGSSSGLSAGNAGASTRRESTHSGNTTPHRRSIARGGSSSNVMLRGNERVFLIAGSMLAGRGGAGDMNPMTAVSKAAEKRMNDDAELSGGQGRAAASKGVGVPTSSPLVPEASADSVGDEMSDEMNVLFKPQVADIALHISDSDRVRLSCFDFGFEASSPKPWADLTGPPRAVQGCHDFDSLWVDVPSRVGYLTIMKLLKLGKASCVLVGSRGSGRSKLLRRFVGMDRRNHGDRRVVTMTSESFQEDMALWSSLSSTYRRWHQNMIVPPDSESGLLVVDDLAVGADADRLSSVALVRSLVSLRQIPESIWPLYSSKYLFLWFCCN